MGSIFLKSVVKNSLVPSNKIIIYDIKKNITEKYSKTLSVQTAKDELELFLNSEYIFIAIKPQFLSKVLEKVLKGLKQLEKLEKINLSQILKSKVIISIAAGITMSVYEETFGGNIPVVRVMPNVLASVNQAASALSKNKNVSSEQFSFVNSIFEKIGLVVQIEEYHMDVVTGLSGSGPAFIAILIESMADGAVKMGMPRDVAYKLAAQTVKGTGEMLLKTELHPGVMKDMVTSPGGTTIVGVHVLEKNNFRSTIISAIEASTLRSKELNERK